MTHDVRFNSKNISTYGLILEDVDLGSPEPQISQVVVPGRNGALDYTEAIAGYTTFNNREMVFSLVRSGSQTDIETTKASFLKDVHGQTVDIYPDWVSGHFHGRASVIVADYRPNFIRLTVNVSAAPYRYASEETEVYLPVGTNSATNGGALPIVPTVITTGSTTITFNGNSYTVAAGSRTIPGIVLMPGDNEITVSRATRLTFTEGYL